MISAPTELALDGEGNAKVPSLELFGIPGAFSQTGLVLRPNLTFEQWDHVGMILYQIREGVEWWIGDWLRYGEERFPDRYSQAMVYTGRAYGTLRNYAYVANSVEPSRRRDTLSFSHHQEVASLPPDEQDEWLDAAEPETPDTPPRLTRNELRTQLRQRDPDNPLSVQDHAGRVLALLQESMREGDWNLVSNAVILQQSLVDRLRS